MEEKQSGLTKRARGITLLVSVCYIVFGLLMILFPGVMASLVCILLGCISLLFGIVKLILYFRKDREIAAMNYDLVIGLLFVILGIVVLLLRNKVLTILPVLFGIFILISALMKIQNAVDIKRFGGSRWWLLLLFSLVSIVLAVLLILRPSFIVNLTFVMIGVFLLIDGVEGVIGMIMFGKSFRHYSKAKARYDEYLKNVDEEKEAFVFPDDAGTDRNER